MSQIKLDNLPAMLPIEPLAGGADLLQMFPAGTDSFDNHLQRARSRPDEPNTTAGSEPGDAERPRRPADVQPAADNRSDDRNDSDGVEHEAQASEKSSAEQAADDASAESDSAQQSAAEDMADSTENGDDKPSGEPSGEPSDENAEDEPNVVLAGNQPVDVLPGEATDEATDEKPGQTAGGLQDHAGTRGDSQGFVAEQDNAAQQGSAEDASARVDAEVQSKAAASGTEPVIDDEVLLPSTAEPTDVAGKKSEKPGDDVGDESAARAQAGGKEKAVVASEQIEQDTGPAGRAADVADSPDAQLLPADAPQTPRRSRGKRGPAVEGNGRVATSGAVAESAAPNVVAGQNAQAITMEAVAGSETHADRAVNMDGPASNDTAGSQNETSTRDGATRAGSATASKGSQQAEGGDGVDRVRFVQRVARAFEAIGDRSRTVRLRLSPPELGSLRLEVTVRGGVMNARVEAETATARNLLLDNLGALRERLAQQDIKIDQFNVDLADRSPGGPFDERAGQMQDQDGDSGNDPQRPTAEAETSEQTKLDAGAVNRPGEGTQLNVVI